MIFPRQMLNYMVPLGVKKKKLARFIKMIFKSSVFGIKESMGFSKKTLMAWKPWRNKENSS